jgi:peptidoglycan hydrolase-like protein with peptidoglycan-binding domain
MGVQPAVEELTESSVAAGPASRPPRRRRRRRGLRIAVAMAVLAAGTLAAVDRYGLRSDGGSGTAAASQLPPATAKVTRQTLKDTQSEDGDLGYGTTTSAACRLAGTLTAVPASGDTVTRGKALYAVDGRPVTLMYGSMPAYRPLSTGDEGQDVRQLERNLRALGYTGFTADDTYTVATASAVKDWQEDLGLDETGVVELGRVVFAPGAVRVDSLDAAKGDALAPGAKVLEYTGTAKAVIAELDTADQQLAKRGAEVGIELPDGSTVKGTITGLSTVIVPASGDQDAQTEVEVVIALKDERARKAATAYDQAAVHVVFTSGIRENVLTVPVAALLALAEGGYGVEVVQGSASTYVPVTTGLFADGRVEISGGGTAIAEGTRVGMPK